MQGQAAFNAYQKCRGSSAMPHDCFIWYGERRRPSSKGRAAPAGRVAATMPHRHRRVRRRGMADSTSTTEQPAFASVRSAAAAFRVRVFSFRRSSRHARHEEITSPPRIRYPAPQRHNQYAATVAEPTPYCNDPQERGTGKRDNPEEEYRRCTARSCERRHRACPRYGGHTAAAAAHAKP